MQEYRITIFKQSRILIGLFLFPILFMASVFIGAESDSFVIPILFLIPCIFIIYYFTVGNLKIIINGDNELFFEWNKKIIFNYNPIMPVKINDIKVIVLDNGEFLRKIKTNKEVIYINNSKIQSKDAHEFIDRLIKEVKENDTRVIDSWDEFAEKGYLKLAYLLNSIILIISIIVVIIFTILKGFNPASLSILLLFIPQIILYQKQIKNKIN